jgi:hypothetical protein
MTALTPLKLPYQTSTDRPCDAATTWCSFTSQAESLLNAVDTSIGRVSPSVPAAMVRRRTPMTLTANTQTAVTFESVVFDTDNMTQLQNGVPILPRRNGRYILTASVQATATLSVFNVIVTHFISYGPAISFQFGSTIANVAIAGNDYGTTISAGSGVNTDAWYRCAGSFEWDGSAQPGFGLQMAGVTGGTLGTIELSAHWISDRIA